jgi:hypothetical protein
MKFLHENSGTVGSYGLSTVWYDAKLSFLAFSIDQGTATFIGCRPRNREVLQRRMYRTEIEEWMREADLADKQVHSSGRKMDENEHLISSSDQIILGGGLMSDADSYQRAVPIN